MAPLQGISPGVIPSLVPPTTPLVDVTNLTALRALRREQETGIRPLLANFALRVKQVKKQRQGTSPPLLQRSSQRDDLTSKEALLSSPDRTAGVRGQGGASNQDSRFPRFQLVNTEPLPAPAEARGQQKVKKVTSLQPSYTIPLQTHEESLCLQSAVVLTC